MSLNMNDIDTIKPGVGLGNLIFGSTRKECKNYLGKPEEISVVDLGNYRQDVAWHHWEKGISLCFDEEDDYRLGSFKTERKTSMLFNDKLIGKRIDEIEEYLKRSGCIFKKNFDYEDSEGYLHLLIEVDALNCSFWFVEDQLYETQWGYLWIDDKTPKWPDKIRA